MLNCQVIALATWFGIVSLSVHKQIDRFKDAFYLKLTDLFEVALPLKKPIKIWYWTFCSMLGWSDVALFHHLCTNRLHFLTVPCIWNNLASEISWLYQQQIRAVCACHWQCCSANHMIGTIEKDKFDLPQLQVLIAISLYFNAIIQHSSFLHANQVSKWLNSYFQPMFYWLREEKKRQ